MADSNQSNQEDNYLNKAVEIAIRLGLLVAIMAWCIMILSPFFSMIIWGIIIAVAVYPLFQKLKTKFKGRGKWASSLITLLMLSFIVVPSIMLTDSLIDGVNQIKNLYEQGGLIIPPPDSRVDSWPKFAKPVVDAWALASKSLETAVMQYKSELADALKWLFALVASLSIGIVQFILSIIIAGVLLVYAESGGDALKKVFVRLAGNQGEKFASLCEATIRQVIKGVLGVAVIQSGLAGIGLIAAGVPGAGLWILLCLILSTVQIGVGPVVIPIVIYVWATDTILTASLLTAWMVVVLISDNILKPLLLGRGAPVPMLVIFLGAIGGLLASGFVGLFLGSVILSLGYKIFEEWLTQKTL